MRRIIPVLLFAVFAGWVLALAINLLGLVVLVLHASYWTGGAYHDPARTVPSAIAVAGCLAIAVLGVAGLFYKQNRGRSAVVVAVAVAVAAANAVPYLVHVAEAQITAQGFAQRRYTTDESYDLVLVNRTAAPVRVCAGRFGDCDGDTPRALASGGVVIAPGRARRVDLPAGTHRLTIADGAPGVVVSDATVKVNPGPSS
jgi:thiamine transporter ThiT